MFSFFPTFFLAFAFGQTQNLTNDFVAAIRVADCREIRVFLNHTAIDINRPDSSGVTPIEAAWARPTCSPTGQFAEYTLDLITSHPQLDLRRTSGIPGRKTVWDIVLSHAWYHTSGHDQDERAWANILRTRTDFDAVSVFGSVDEMLMKAADRGFAEVMALAVTRYGANVNTVDPQSGQSAVFRLIQRNLYPYKKFFVFAEKTNLHLRPFDFSARDPRTGNTLLETFSQYPWSENDLEFSLLRAKSRFKISTLDLELDQVWPSPDLRRIFSRGQDPLTYGGNRQLFRFWDDGVEARVLLPTSEITGEAFPFFDSRELVIRKASRDCYVFTPQYGGRVRVISEAECARKLEGYVLLTARPMETCTVDCGMSDNVGTGEFVQYPRQSVLVTTIGDQLLKVSVNYAVRENHIEPPFRPLQLRFGNDLYVLRPINPYLSRYWRNEGFVSLDGRRFLAGMMLFESRN